MHPAPIGRGSCISAREPQGEAAEPWMAGRDWSATDGGGRSRTL